MQFKFRIIEDALSKRKSFRMKFGDQIIGLGNLDVLKNADNETLALYLENILNTAWESAGKLASQQDGNFTD